MIEKNEPEMPRCEYKGCLPHPAVPAYLLIWSLPSGPVVKWSCADHRFSFGGNRTPVVAKVECFEEDKPSCTHCESGDWTVQATCVDPECGNPAPYKGAWCDSCQSRWEDEQRAKALRAGRPVRAGLRVASKNLLGSDLLPRVLLPTAPKESEAGESAA
ncbi:MAG TPA: hypothetical protein VNZ03_00050 [Terriglobales bacterium]|jgi:hypothetical protein|nr:hypothetical protein [Terriglobales bacterium]